MSRVVIMYEMKRIVSGGKLYTVKLVRTLSGEVRLQKENGKIVVMDEETFKKKYREVGVIQ